MSSVSVINDQQPDCKTFKPAKYVDVFYDYLEKEVTPCTNLKKFGGRLYRNTKKFDGFKYICLDPEYDVKPGNCNVLSFGINNEWSFDDAMDKFGCKVFSFDPTMNKPSHNRSKNIQFYNLGLSALTGTIKLGGKLSKVDRYTNILDRVKLKDEYIDYLKMDIEGSELDFFDDVFTNNPELMRKVKQIGVEIHPGGVRLGISRIGKLSVFNLLLHHFQRLECMGFHLLAMNKNDATRNVYKYKGKQQSCCYELVFGRIPT